MAAEPSQDKNIEKLQKSQKSQRSQSPTGLLILPAAAPQAATRETNNLFLIPLLGMRMYCGSQTPPRVSIVVAGGPAIRMRSSGVKNKLSVSHVAAWGAAAGRLSQPVGLCDLCDFCDFCDFSMFLSWEGSAATTHPHGEQRYQK